MSEEMWSDGVSKTRSALGDVTNLVGKRGYPLISKSGVNKKDDGLRYEKKERRTTENCKNEIIEKEIVDCVLRIDSSKGNAVDGIVKVACENKKPCPPGARQNADSDTFARSCDDVRLFTTSSPISLPARLSDRVETENVERKDSLENNPKEQVETSINTNNGDHLTLDNLDFSKGDYLDCSSVVPSQESRSCGLEKCAEQKGVGCSSTDMGSIKACSCSFCMKAAYIWSDLHYQDVKGRMAAIKKSQKEASILVQRNSRGNEIGKYGQQSSGKISILESDLTDNWRSFFLHVEDIFVRESIQLETSLLTLRDLRDNCKSDLNPTDAIHLKKK